MICIIIKGGLCNQLFMLFAGISYSIDNSIDFCIYPTLIAKNYFDNFFINLKDKVIKELPKDYIKYDEPNYHYNKIPTDNTNIIIEGFFQSEKYFIHNYDKIIKMFDIKVKRKEIKNEFPENYFNNTISLHFRIGDYLGLQYNHPILNLNYYNNSIKYLSTKININNYKILIFCQECDKSIINNSLKYLNHKNIIMINDIKNDYDELLIMSLCNHNIIANSTFSWFGAYLNDNQNKIICYPEIWFGKGLINNDTKDLFIKNWTKIK